MSEYHIAIMPGDGIGHEVMDACLHVLATLQRVADVRLTTSQYSAGAQHYQKTGAALDERTLKDIAKADAILFGAMGWPDIRYPDGTEIAPQLDIRIALNLFAGVRPCRKLPGIPAPLRSPLAQNIDFVIVREQTEGLFFSRGRGKFLDADTVQETMQITRAGCERVFDFAFDLTRDRKAERARRGLDSRVTCVDKANVFTSLAFMRKVFAERAAKHTDIQADAAYIDAMALNLVRAPWRYDVLVTENMFGDILSDLGAGLIGGMGFAPSADLGHEHGLFQPCHGSAPDIFGQRKANPTAMILSAALMLAWLGKKHSDSAATHAARLLETAVEEAFSTGMLQPYEVGGQAGTDAIAGAIVEQLSHYERATAA